MTGARTAPDDNGNHAVWSFSDAYCAIYRRFLDAINADGSLHIIATSETKQ